MQQLSMAGIDQTRSDLDQYFTPDWLSDRMVSWGISAWRRQAADHVNKWPTILEPCAGQGAIVRAALARGCSVVAYEVDRDHASILLRRYRPAIAEGRLTLICGNFFHYAGDYHIDLAVTNPPYRQDTEFMSRILEYSPMAIALLRTVFLNGVGRWDKVWSQHQLRRVAHLKRRPRFGGAFQPKTDFSVYDIRYRPRGMTSDQPHTVQVRWW
jgi:predicted RNA methylase